MIKTAVIPAAGLGTRLLPSTKEHPKEMLPIFMKRKDGTPCLKPLLQIIFEELHNNGITSFCFITGRAKRSIEDHFTPDYTYLTQLKEDQKISYLEEMQEFYQLLEKSDIIWINQAKPRGFGDAILRVQSIIHKNENFIVYAGDNYIISPKKAYLSKLFHVHEHLESDATFLVNKVKYPSLYGIMVGDQIDSRVYKVRQVIEKPRSPPSKMAIHAVYIFNDKIFQGLRTINHSIQGELQLTDGIQWLIENDLNVYAIELEPNEVRIDIGNPYYYWQAIKASYENL